MTTALYRRYRPETFAEVVGQDHVTAPLRQALRSGQTNHAYLFSGPRGCGKTTSARILARCLNCAEGPTDTPCGVCPSCVELARGGPGSLDVVEIDAASHGGVDDARDLRERATFAPARDRYKVFILDEAHMVSPQGFNALLKIVEEPPEHVKFIFATTEPDKVIGTIRSRTHHYPFRLVPPDVMVGYLDQLCTTEDVTVGSGVLPLVVRAGGGSVRDSLSVLDQLIAGSGPDGLVYEDAVALLGYTHASLLDDLVEAIAARDGASAFRVVERVISTGHEPRRFVEDLLERLRDLIVLAASGDAAAAVLRDVPGDQMARMQQQAAHLGAAELSRSADLVNAALSEMTGATSPRLHLELLMARLLLPALDDSAAGIGARVDRLEREGVRAASGLAGAPVATAPPVAAPAFAPAAPVERVAVVTPPPSPAPEVRAAEETLRASGAGSAQGDDAVGAGAGDASGAEASGSGERAAGEQRPDERRPGPAEDAEATAGRQPEHAPADERYPEPEVAPVAEPARAAAPAAPAAPPAPAAEERPMAHDVPTAEPVAPAERPAGAPGGGDTEMLRRRWPEVLDTLARLKKTTWVLISQNAQVVELDATTLKLGFGAPGLASAFRSGPHADLVQQAVRETLGFSVKVEPVLSGGGPAAPRPGSGPAPSPAPAARGGGAPSSAEAAASWDAPAARPAPVPSPVEAARAPHDAPAAGPSGVDAPADDDPDAADPWSSATVTPAGGGTAGEGAADGASDDRADDGDPAGDPSRAAAADGRGVREDAARGGVAREGAGAEAFGERASGEIAAEHASGDRASGDVVSGDVVSGDGASGDVAAGDGASADTVSAGRASADTASADRASADTVSADRASGDPASADLASGGGVPGGPASGGPASGGPEADGPASAGRAPGDSASARSAAGDSAPGAPVRGGSPSGGSAPAAAPVRPPAPVVAVSDDGWPAVAPLGGARPASSTPGAAAADSGDGARPDDPASAARDRVASADARADGPGRPGVDGAPASARARGAEALAGPAAPGAAASGPAARPGSDDRSGSDDRPATRASGSGRPAARPAPTDPGAPPPWDPHPDDPGAPEPPDDDWARDVPLPPDPGPDPYAAPSRPAATATAPPSPAPTSGADRVRAAARAAAAGGGSVATAPRVAWADDEPSMDDPDIGSSTLSGIPLLAQALGATVIDEPVDEGF